MAPSGWAGPTRLLVWPKESKPLFPLFGDNGEPGHEAAEKAAEKFTSQGRRVVLRFPPESFGDWNDALQALCKETA